MAQRADDEKRADAAWKVFYSRYVGWLWGKCHRVAHVLGGATWVEDIFLDTMETAYLRAGKFRVPPNSSADAIESRIKAWLGAITKNNLHRRLEGRTDEITVTDEQWEVINFDRERQAKAASESALSEQEQEAFTEAFASLSEREQTVLRVTYEYYRFGSKFQRLTNEATQALAAQLGTTPENLRAIRKRATDKLRARLFPAAADTKT